MTPPRKRKVEFFEVRSIIKANHTLKTHDLSIVFTSQGTKLVDGGKGKQRYRKSYPLSKSFVIRQGVRVKSSGGLAPAHSTSLMSAPLSGTSATVGSPVSPLLKPPPGIRRAQQRQEELQKIQVLLDGNSISKSKRVILLSIMAVSHVPLQAVIATK